MQNNHVRPNWLILILLSGIILRLFWLEVKAPFSQAGHIWAEIGLALLLYGVVAGWLKVNELAFTMEDRENLPVLTGRFSNPIPGADLNWDDHSDLKHSPSRYRISTNKS